MSRSDAGIWTQAGLPASRAPPKWTRNFGYDMPSAYGAPPICYLKLKVLNPRQPGTHSGRRKH